MLSNDYKMLKLDETIMKGKSVFKKYLIQNDVFKFEIFD